VHILAGGGGWGSLPSLFGALSSGLLEEGLIDRINFFTILIRFCFRSIEGVGEACVALDFVINSVPSFVLPIREEKYLGFRLNRVHILLLN
jgi:hypothetical protein